jgi:hypothetical protein
MLTGRRQPASEVARQAHHNVADRRQPASEVARQRVRDADRQEAACLRGSKTESEMLTGNWSNAITDTQHEIKPGSSGASSTLHLLSWQSLLFLPVAVALQLS